MTGGEGRVIGGVVRGLGSNFSMVFSCLCGLEGVS